MEGPFLMNQPLVDFAWVSLASFGFVPVPVPFTLAFGVVHTQCSLVFAPHASGFQPLFKQQVWTLLASPLRK